VLSDTTDRAVRAAEREAWRRSRAPGGLAVWYRHRPRNHHRKAGNIADWVQRFGGAYEHFVILDADSIMTADALLGLVAMIEVDPRAGLIQTLPLLVEARTPFARLQQFAARLHGPLIAAGLAWWHGDAGNYWGHNAIIRTRAFAESAGLPELPGRRPFGGHVLSHDFVEAALLRRAGWTVRMAPLLPGSYEGGPPSLPDAAARDRRWCQGNLQHLGVLGAAGLHPLSRLHLASGIFAYLGSPLWLLFLVLGVLLTLAGEPEAARYFPHGHALFPAWPMDAERARGLFAVTLVVLLAPKLLAWLAAVADPVSRRGFGGGLRLSASALLEMLLAALLAPIMMLTQVSQIAGILLGRDGGWRVQARDGRRLPVVDVARAYAGHVLAGIVLLGACFVAPSVGLWLAPVIAGPLLAVPLVVLTADPALGRALNRRGLLLTPEEIAPHPVLVAARARPAVPPPQRRPGRARVPRAIRRTTALLRAAA
jgi:membrane glycosyltransferase